MKRLKNLKLNLAKNYLYTVTDFLVILGNGIGKMNLKNLDLDLRDNSWD